MKNYFYYKIYDEDGYSIEEDELYIEKFDDWYKEIIKILNDLEYNGKVEVNITLNEPYEDYIDIDDILEDMSNRAYNEGGDYALEYLQYTSENSRKWFEEEINKLWIKFKEMNNESSPFSNILKEKSYIFEIKDSNVKLIEEL